MIRAQWTDEIFAVFSSFWNLLIKLHFDLQFFCTSVAVLEVCWVNISMHFFFIINGLFHFDTSIIKAITASYHGFLSKWQICMQSVSNYRHRLSLTVDKQNKLDTEWASIKFLLSFLHVFIPSSACGKFTTYYLCFKYSVPFSCDNTLFWIISFNVNWTN